MPAEAEPLEYLFAAGSLSELRRSGLTLLKARRVRSRSDTQGAPDLAAWAYQALYIILIYIPAIFLEVFHRIRTRLTGEPKAYPLGTWQFYLHFGLREDPAHFTTETIGYNQNRPAEASELDDLTAWVMTVIQFIWGYEDLMGVIWDEWTMLRLVMEEAEKVGCVHLGPFKNMLRQWELDRPYSAPLNGTYADVRRGVFEQFIAPRLQALPEQSRANVKELYRTLAGEKRERYQQQMSLLARLKPGRYLDGKEPISLWNVKIGLVLRGRYHLIDVVAHDEKGSPVVYGPGGNYWPLAFRNGEPVDSSGRRLTIRGEQLFREQDGEWVGYLDMAPVSRVKWQLRQLLQSQPDDQVDPSQATDILLAETPRSDQSWLRRLLPNSTYQAVEHLRHAPIIVNWEGKLRDNSLAELRRTHRGIGDHALTIIKTDGSVVFDQSHVFFDGTWAMAMAEVLTTAAIQWCKRCITIAPSEAPFAQSLIMETSPQFLKEARVRQRVPEVSAETTIWDISQIFKLRERLLQTGTRLTVNDLLVITRIFHAAHYRPSPNIQKELANFRVSATTALDRQAITAIERSLLRGRIINPALLIPVDASPQDPQERLFPITFRNLADNLVWIWDDTWEAYQAYRRIEPPDTPEGMEALKKFALKRTFLIGNLRAFSFILAANKSVALRGESLNIAILKLLAHLPTPLQKLLNNIPELLPVLNEVIKGDEVYSNVGRIAKGSTITRFMSAKDDGSTKALIWGVMTDDNNRLIVTMRDFRPHVKPLAIAGRSDLAHLMAQDYVVTYTADLIGLVARLTAMLQAETPSQS